MIRCLKCFILLDIIYNTDDILYKHNVNKYKANGENKKKKMLLAIYERNNHITFKGYYRNYECSVLYWFFNYTVCLN